MDRDAVKNVGRVAAETEVGRTGPQNVVPPRQLIRGSRCPRIGAFGFGSGSVSVRSRA